MLPKPRASLEDGCLDPSKRSIWNSLTFCSGVKAPSKIEVCKIVGVKTPPTYVCVVWWIVNVNVLDIKLIF